ncbi:MAG: hypothetical protein RSE00_01110 [Clostridia bacterium]
MKKSKNTTKNIFLIILIVVVLLLGSYLILLKFNVGGTDEKANFVKEIANLQNKVSYYVGETYSDTFGTYDKTQIITGKTKDSKEIKDTKGVKLTPIVDEASKIDKNKTISYKLNEQNVKQVLKIDLPKYKGLTFCVQDGELIKVQLDKAPSWWTSDLDVLLVGRK